LNAATAPDTPPARASCALGRRAGVRVPLEEPGMSDGALLLQAR